MYFHAYKHKLNSEPWLSDKTNFLMDLNCSTEKKNKTTAHFVPGLSPQVYFFFIVAALNLLEVLDGCLHVRP